MPKRTDIKSILIIGAGPIVIGQACEFDYSGTQACKALKAEGIKLLCYTVNDPVQARALFNAGVDALCTDRLDLITPNFFDHRYIH